MVRERAYICPSLEYNHLLPRTLAVRKRTDSLCALIFEPFKQLVKLRDSERLEKPLAARKSAAGWAVDRM